MEILYTKVREKVSDCDIFILLCVSFMCVCALPLKKCTKWDINNHHQVTVYACTLYACNDEDDDQNANWVLLIIILNRYSPVWVCVSSFEQANIRTFIPFWLRVCGLRFSSFVLSFFFLIIFFIWIWLIFNTSFGFLEWCFGWL